MELDVAAMTAEQVKSLNKRMVKSMTEALQGDKDMMRAMKQSSQAFRKRELSPEEFWVRQLLCVCVCVCVCVPAWCQLLLPPLCVLLRHLSLLCHGLY